MAVTRQIWFLFLFSIWLSGCTTVQHVSNAKVSYEPISSSTTPDADLTAMITPYREKLEKQMNEVLGTINQELTKKKPESTLGNWATDALLASAKKEGHAVDFAISNYGGLRIPSLAAGPLTMGEVYELSPFDNLMVIIEIPGSILDTLFQKIAASEGWPVSKGVRMTIHDKKMTSCMINGKAIDPSASYQVAMTDYVANGGDDMSMLINLPRIQTGKMVREAIIDYAREATRNGKDISASIEGRIIVQ